MGMDLELIPVPLKPRMHRRILGEAKRRIQETYLYDTALWRTALSGLWTLSFLAFTVNMLGMPTGLGVPADIIFAAVTGTLVLAVTGNLAAVLIALTGWRVPRLFVGCLLSDIGIVLLILYFGNVDLAASAAVTGLAAGLSALGGIALGLLRDRRTAAGLVLTTVLVLSPVALGGGYSVDEDKAPTPAPAYNAPSPLTAANPGEPGDYSYTAFTYASGEDLHRAEYGSRTELISSAADASAYTGKGWPDLRTLFWGFNYSNLPLNGRVYMPEGDGPYPLVLMVHGNHMMEDFSDAGYAYLGELLASRGFIAVSLDENFLNYSSWSGIPENDFKVRAWLILKHLEQIAEFAGEPGNPFYDRIDFSRTALLGHSRGGQAVAMAADGGRWFRNDPVWQKVMDRYHISSVIALAPTDKAIDGLQPRLKDISYLTLQGARDADVHDFYGDRQYIRSSYSPGSDAFKSSLYIADANHSQFNTDWGQLDQTLPAGLFLDRKQIMDGDEQRQIAKVYVSAFLETTLHESGEYRDLFRDYRNGLQWLPDTAYYSRFQGGDYLPLITFDGNHDTRAQDGKSDQSQGVTWSEELAKDREDRSKGTYGLVLERTAKQGEEAYYRISLDKRRIAAPSLLEAEGLSFSLANQNSVATPQAADEEGPAIEVELTDRNDTSARLPLSKVMEVLPLPYTQFTLSPWLEKRINAGKYSSPTEAVFQTYELPFEEFKEVEPELEPEYLTDITFYLEEEGDKVMLDDIGFYSNNLSLEGR